MKRTAMRWVLGAVCAVWLSMARGDVVTWDGGGTSLDWSDAFNWGGTAPANGDDLVFGNTFWSGVALTNDLLSDVNSLTFINLTDALTLTGDAITLNAGLFNTNTTAGRAVTIQNDIYLGAAQEWIAQSANGVTFIEGDLTGSVNLVIKTTDARSTLPAFRLSGNNAGYTGNISLGPISGSQTSGLMLMNAGAMIGGNINIDNTDHNLWIKGGAGVGTYAFGIGSGAGNVRFRRDAGTNNGLHLEGGDAEWRPGGGGDYILPTTYSGVRIGPQLASQTTPFTLTFGHTDDRLIVGSGGFAYTQSGGNTLTDFRYALSDDGTARDITLGANLIMRSAARDGHLGGKTTISGGTVAISDMNQLFTGNVMLHGGVLLLDGMSWNDFASSRTAGFAGNAVPTSGTGDSIAGSTTLSPGTYTYRIAHFTDAGANVYDRTSTFTAGNMPRLRNFGGEGAVLTRIWRQNGAEWDLVYEGPASAGFNFTDNGLLLVANDTTPGIQSTASLTGAAWSLGTGTVGGFAARGETLTIANDSGNWLAAYYFNRDFRLGTNLKDSTGAFYANAGVTVAQDTILTGRRTVSVASTGPGIIGAAEVGTVNEFSGNLTGLGSLHVTSVTLGTAGELAELVLSGVNDWTGSPYMNINLGPGGLAANGAPGNTDNNSGFVRFGNPGALPIGNGANPAYLAALKRNGNDYQQGFLVTGGATEQVYDPADGYKFVLGGSGNSSSKVGTLGSTGGRARLQGADVAILSGIGVAANSSINLGLLVRDGVLTLGAAGAGDRVAFQPAYLSAGAADGGLNAAATPLQDRSGTSALVKRGEGTLALANVAYTLLDGTGNTSAQFSWQLGRSAGGNTGANAYFDGAVRGRVGGDNANSLANFTLNMRGGVYEFDISAGTTTANLTLGIGAGQVNWRPNNNTDYGGGGFAAYSSVAGNRLVIDLQTSGVRDNLIWNQNPGYFIGANGGSTGVNLLILGSRTANAPVEFYDNIDMWGSNNPGAWREVRVYDNPDSAADLATLSGVLSGSGTAARLLKTGDGTLILSGDNTYDNGTWVQAGTLCVNNTAGSGTGSGMVTVSAGASLGGDGMIGGMVSVETGGILAPGNSAGALTIANNMSLDSMTYLWELGDTAVDHDRVNVNALSFNGAPTITLDLRSIGAYVPQATDAFALFSVLTGAPAVGDADWHIVSTDFNTDGAYVYASDNEIYLTGLTPVPEPATLALLGLGGALAFRRRRTI